MKHGHWIEGQLGFGELFRPYEGATARICSECRCIYPEEIIDWRWDYCPHCGARMIFNDKDKINALDI